MHVIKLQNQIIELELSTITLRVIAWNSTVDDLPNCGLVFSLGALRGFISLCPI